MNKMLASIGLKSIAEIIVAVVAAVVFVLDTGSEINQKQEKFFKNKTVREVIVLSSIIAGTSSFVNAAIAILLYYFIKS